MMLLFIFPGGGSTMGNGCGVIGFSLGCSYALEIARSRSDNVAAVVLFYGTGGGKYHAVQADFLGHFAENDQWGAHAEKVSSLKKRLSQSDGQVIFHTYPGTNHWFFESDRTDAYNEAAAKEARIRTIEFLRLRLQ
jgi:carboxymethylenebutenolidase